MRPAHDHTASLTAWIRGKVLRHLHQHGHRLLQAGGQLGDLFVGPAEARAQFAPTLARSLDLPPLPDAIPDPPVVAALRERLELSHIDAGLLLAAAAPALDVDLARLYTFAWADFAQKLPTVGFLAELVGGGRSRFAADAPLMRRRLVHLVDGDRWSPGGPRLHRGVVASEAVVDWLEGATSRPAAIATIAEWQAPKRAALRLPDGVEAQARQLLDAALVAGGRLILQGRPGSGRRSLVRAGLAAHDRPLLVLDLAALAIDDMAAALAAADHTACLNQGLVFLRIPATLDRSADVTLRAHLAAARAPHCLALGQHDAQLSDLDIPRLIVPAPDAADQLVLWQIALQQAGVTSEHLPDFGATRFDLTPGAIHDAARRIARTGDTSTAGLNAAVDAQVQHTLGALAEPVRTTLTWDDVVLPDDVMSVLLEVQSQARNRARVFDEWGFRQKMSYGRGLSCLFAGPPGTGKTMVAGVIAATLGRPLYRVDLSRVVSKWVGETEKNLARVFDEAERAQVILFFDEADSLFAKRTEVQGAQDRFANMEVNYLLQRMEQFDGMSILTTNFERGLDEAFKRRLRFRVYFPMPEVADRAELWRRVVPARLPIADDVRWIELARRFKFSGGNIKNAMLRAAFHAAAGDGVVTEALIVAAADAEKRELGRL